MKAVILAAGKGTRMGDLTEETPKPMLLVEGRPILEHILTGLREAGIQEFCLITGWKAEVIESHFGDGSAFGVQINYVRQEVQDGTGKAPELAKVFVGEAPFLLTYGDILVKPDTYRQMLARWDGGELSGLVTVTGSEDVTKGGLFFFDNEFFLQHLVEKPSAAQLEALGAELVEVSCPRFNDGIATYYVIAPSEASANLARYDGVKYGFRADDAESLAAMTARSRAEGFGAEVQRRILIGTYALSAGYVDAYYKKAQQVRTLIRRDFDAAFQSVDVLLTPTAPSTAFKAGAHADDPLAMYLADLLTIPVNLAGLPAISVPCGFSAAGLPIGMQLIGNVLDEPRLLQVAHQYEQAAQVFASRPEAALVP